MAKPGPKPGTPKTPEHQAAITAALPKGPAHHRFKREGLSAKAGRLRAEALYPNIGPCERCGSTRSERHHKDDDTSNNDRSNIAILCRRCHMAIDGRLSRMRQVRAAVRQPGAPHFDADQIAKILQLRAGGLSQSAIAERFGVGQSCISRILNGKRSHYAVVIGGVDHGR